MSAHDTIFAGSIPRLYDTYLVPHSFLSASLDIPAGRRLRGADREDAGRQRAAGSSRVQPLAPKLAPGARYCALRPTSISRCSIMPRERQAADRRGLLATGGRPCIAFRRRRVRCRLLPVRRHVLARPRGWVSEGCRMSSSPMDASYSPSGIALIRTHSPTMSHRRSQRYFRAIRRASWRGRPTATMRCR